MGLKVLIVDGSWQGAHLLKRMQELEFDATLVADQGSLNWEIDKGWHAVVSEWTLGRDGGPELLRRLRPDRRPVYVLSDHIEARQNPDLWKRLGVKERFDRLARVDLFM